MRAITVTVEMPWPKGKTSLEKLERTAHRAAMAAGRRALLHAIGAWEAELHPPAWLQQGPARLEIASADAAGNVSRRYYDLGAVTPLPGWIATVAAALLGAMVGGMALVLRPGAARARG